MNLLATVLSPCLYDHRFKYQLIVQLYFSLDSAFCGQFSLVSLTYPCLADQDCTTWNAVPVLTATPLGLVQGIVRAVAVLPAH